MIVLKLAFIMQTNSMGVAKPCIMIHYYDDDEYHDAAVKHLKLNDNCIDSVCPKC